MFSSLALRIAYLCYLYSLIRWCNQGSAINLKSESRWLLISFNLVGGQLGWWNVYFTARYGLWWSLIKAFSFLLKYETNFKMIAPLTSCLHMWYINIHFSQTCLKTTSTGVTMSCMSVELTKKKKMEKWESERPARYALCKILCL